MTVVRCDRIGGVRILAATAEGQRSPNGVAERGVAEKCQVSAGQRTDVEWAAACMIVHRPASLAQQSASFTLAVA